MYRRKKILLTGATSGIGKAAAFRLAEQGHHVIVHGRNTDKAEGTRQEILASVPDAEVDVLIADLSRKADVLSMVEIFNTRYDGLDVLINNAGGAMNKQREETVDGWEKTIAVNVLAPYMLSALLYPQLEDRSISVFFSPEEILHLRGPLKRYFIRNSLFKFKNQIRHVLLAYNKPD